MRRFGDLVVSANAVVSFSHLPLKFTFSPTRIFARDVFNTRSTCRLSAPHHVDARHHVRPPTTILFSARKPTSDNPNSLCLFIARSRRMAEVGA
jgi:hypothetical protein